MRGRYYLGALHHGVGRRPGAAQLLLVLPDEGLELLELELRVEVPGHGGDHPAHAGADGGVPVAADLVPLVPDPVPGQVAAHDILADPGHHPVAVLLPHPAGLVQGHVEVPGQHPDLAGARQAVQDQTLLVGVVVPIIPTALMC